MTEDAERIADIIRDTLYTDRGDLLLQVAAILREEGHCAHTASVLQAAGDSLNGD